MVSFIRYAINGSILVVIETIIYWVFFNGLFEKKRQSWMNGFIMLAFPICLIVLSYFGQYGLPDSAKLLMILVIGFILAKILFRASWKNIIIYQCVWALFSVIGDALTIGILSISHDTVQVTEILDNFTMAVQGMILSKTINIVLVSIFIKKMGKEKNRYSFSEVCIMLLQGMSGIACLTMVIEFSYYKVSTYKVTSIYLIIVSILILAAYVVFNGVFENYVKKRSIEQEAMKVQFYNKGQYEYYSALEEENLNIRKMYHDIKNHLLVIQGLKEANTDLYEAYIQDCLIAVEGYNEFYDTGSKLADIILYEKCNMAKTNHIETRIMVQKDSLNDIEMLDLCAILTNSFDNAVEACKKCHEERHIQVKTIKNEAALIITFKNNYETEPIMTKQGELMTDKKNKAEHGVGMQSIKMAAKKYNGNVEISLDREKKEFLLIIMIPNSFVTTV
ncbi:MAG: ATP-binding protein [Lachnotalea sp.]